MMAKLRVLYNVHISFSSMVNTKLDMETWSNRHPDYWSIVASIEALRRRNSE